MIKELVIISGKGGTGKTSLTAAFSSLVQNKVLCDADVDAADLHLIMNPLVRETHEFRSGHKAVINPDKCTQCGLCAEMCRWNAVREDFSVDSFSCEGCGVCVWFCPEKAVEFPENTCGEWFISDTRFGTMVHARLGIAEENSGKLVTLVRRKARELAGEKGNNLILTDGPPGIGCPVIASVGGASAVLIVTEPTVSGRHDMERVAQLAAHFKVPAILCINKSDLNLDKTAEIEAFAKEKGIIFAGNIPFDPIFTKAMVMGQTLFEYDSNSETVKRVKEIWKNVTGVLNSLN